MNQISIITLKALRKVYTKLFRHHSLPYDKGITDPNKVSELVYKLLASGKPCMIARFGSTELYALTNYLGVIAQNHSIWKYIQGEQFEWWWEKKVATQMTRWSGFFPSTEKNLMRFGELMLNDYKQCDCLGSWLRNEIFLSSVNCHINKFWLIFLDPFWVEKPWTLALTGKKVLVIHPFAEIIESQYHNHRKELFKNPSILPDFKLITIKAVQSLGGKSDYKSWFDALDYMKGEMEKVDYDIALIGCGAYGFPLAAHAKRMGKQAVHIGGSLQLLFGIKGKRWESPNYAIRARSVCPNLCYPNLFNAHWIRPTEYKSENADSVENGCYW